MKILSSIMLIVLLAFGSLLASGADRYIGKHQLPSKKTIVVAEGESEARSTGSFSVRLYDSAPAGDETTFFLHGLIEPRDGFIDYTLLHHIRGEQYELVVSIRSAGTGGHQSAYLFTFEKNQRVVLLATVKDLAATADCVVALKKSAEAVKK